MRRTVQGPHGVVLDQDGRLLRQPHLARVVRTAAPGTATTVSGPATPPANVRAPHQGASVRQRPQRTKHQAGNVRGVACRSGGTRSCFIALRGSGGLRGRQYSPDIAELLFDLAHCLEVGGAVEGIPAAQRQSHVRPAAVHHHLSHIRLARAGTSMIPKHSHCRLITALQDAQPVCGAGGLCRWRRAGC